MDSKQQKKKMNSISPVKGKKEDSIKERQKSLPLPRDRPEKYVEVVRKKDERAALPGRSCYECERFYEALEDQGILTPNGRQEMINTCSRHRSRYTPPTTPEGFWGVSLNTPAEWKK